MTIADHILTPAVDQAHRPERALELRWSCSAVACAGVLGLDAARVHHHELATLRITIEPCDGDMARMSADLEHRGRAVSILNSRLIVCRTTVCTDMLSLDAIDGPRRLFSVTVRDDGDLLYARSDLLAGIGLGGGTYDQASITPFAFLLPIVKTSHPSSSRTDAACHVDSVSHARHVSQPLSVQ